MGGGVVKVNNSLEESLKVLLFALKIHCIEADIRVFFVLTSQGFGSRIAMPKTPVIQQVSVSPSAPAAATTTTAGMYAPWL